MPLADLGIDSLMTVEVVVAAEDRFELLVDDDAWPRFKTVLDAAPYIDQAAAGILTQVPRSQGW